jgi:hypothetical protein
VGQHAHKKVPPRAMLDGAKVSTSPPCAGERSVRGDARASAAPRYDVRWPQDSGFGLGPLSNTINVGAALVLERRAACLAHEGQRRLADIGQDQRAVVGHQPGDCGRRGDNGSVASVGNSLARLNKHPCLSMITRVPTVADPASR